MSVYVKLSQQYQKSLVGLVGKCAHHICGDSDPTFVYCHLWIGSQWPDVLSPVLVMLLSLRCMALLDEKIIKPATRFWLQRITTIER